MALAEFHSKSAELAKEQEAKRDTLPMPKESVIRYVKGERIVFFYGNCKSDLAIQGKEVGFEIHPLENLARDVSPLITAKSLVISEVPRTNDLFLVRTIAFAVNYGVPVVWVNHQIEPGKWIWSMRLVVVGENNPTEVWRKICQIAD